jgi:hypothetical protein
VRMCACACACARGGARARVRVLARAAQAAHGRDAGAMGAASWRGAGGRSFGKERGLQGYSQFILIASVLSVSQCTRVWPQARFAHTPGRRAHAVEAAETRATRASWILYVGEEAARDRSGGSLLTPDRSDRSDSSGVTGVTGLSSGVTHQEDRSDRSFLTPRPHGVMSVALPPLLRHLNTEHAVED